MTSPREAAATLFQILDRLNIIYAVGGSFASSFHGVSRATQDIDVVIDLSSNQVDAFYKALAPHFYVDSSVLNTATGIYFNAAPKGSIYHSNILRRMFFK